LESSEDFPLDLMLILCISVLYVLLYAHGFSQIYVVQSHTLEKEGWMVPLYSLGASQLF
jgi:hypothetical protein